MTHVTPEHLAVNISLPPPPFGTVQNPVRVMLAEHDAAGYILRRMREASSDYAVPPDGCISYKTLYRALTAFEVDLHPYILRCKYAEIQVLIRYFAGGLAASLGIVENADKE